MLCGNEKDTSSAQWILLTTTALVAFAGAAVADGHTGVSWAGNATLGYNDDVEDGFFWDGDLDVTMSQTLDNGITAAISAELNVASDDTAASASTAQFDELVISLSTETAALRFGDLDPVAEANWGGVDGSAADDFYDKDVHFLPIDIDGDGTDENIGFDAMLVGELTLGAVTAMMSVGVDSDGTAELVEVDEVDALQFYATGDMGAVSVELAYQAAIETIIGDSGSRFGVAASTAFAGADVTLAYVTRDGNDLETDETSVGLAVAYPFGPVTVGAYVTSNDEADNAYGVSADYVDGPVSISAFYDFEGGEADVDDDTKEFGVEGSYDLGNGLTVLAGYISTDVEGTDTTAATYIAGVYDLGGGAELLVSYADDESNATNDEIGDPEYNHGTTVAVSFKF